jgi:hypothetical protein
MNGRARTYQTVWLTSLLAALALSGCSSGDAVTSSLTLEVRPSSPPPPFYVNITRSDFDQFPILEKLLVNRWEGENMRGAGFSEPYPYGEGLALIRELQDREPAGYWRAGTVVISYKQGFFDLIADAPPHDGTV